MCGRVALFSPPRRLARLLAVGLGEDVAAASPHWNVGPAQTLFAAADTPQGRLLGRYRWGLTPHWSGARQVLFNARAETVADKPSFRAAFRDHPAVIPVDGFYEWDHRPASARQPHYFSRANAQPLLLAGLVDPAGPDGPACAVITTTPSDDLDGLHDRMPVILELDDVAGWLAPGDAGRAIRTTLLHPAARGTLVHHRVGAAVGSMRHDDASLIEPLSPTLFSPGMAEDPE